MATATKSPYKLNVIMKREKNSSRFPLNFTTFWCVTFKIEVCYSVVRYNGEIVNSKEEKCHK